MLVLTRKVGQGIHIGDSITVVYLGSVGGQLKLGITAPPDVKIYRDNIKDKLGDANECPPSN